MNPPNFHWIHCYLVVRGYLSKFNLQIKLCCFLSEDCISLICFILNTMCSVSINRLIYQIRWWTCLTIISKVIPVIPEFRTLYIRSAPGILSRNLLNDLETSKEVCKKSIILILFNPIWDMSDLSDYNRCGFESQNAIAKQCLLRNQHN